jgi:hypothetical protein
MVDGRISGLSALEVGMTGKEKIMAAFDKGGTREAAAVICHESIFIRDHWDELFAHPWWFQETHDLDSQFQWRSEFIQDIGQDWFRVGVGSSIADSQHVRLEPGEDEVAFVDDRDNRRTVSQKPDKGGMQKNQVSTDERNPVQTCSKEHVDRTVAELYGSDPDLVVTEGRDRLARKLIAGFGQEYCPIYYMGTPACRCYGLWGFEAMMVNMATEKELVFYACQKLLEASVREVRTAALLGAQVIWVEEYFTDIISPDMFIAYGVSYTSQLFAAIKALGMKSIYYFTGNPAGKMEQILSTGADALAFEESKKGFVLDIEEIAEEIDGRCALLGNLDSVGILQNGDHAAISDEVKRQLSAGKRNRNRFIMSLGSPVTPATPVQKVKTFLRLVRENQAIG